MDELTVSLVVIFLLITLAPFAARRFGLPVIVIEIIAGILIGVSWLDIIPPHQLYEFLGSFGLVYLMFLAGVEVNVGLVKKHFRKTIAIAAASLGVPFLAGVSLSGFLNVHPLILGTILATTSLGLILPLAREIRHRRRLSQVLLASVLIVDVVSLFILAFSLSYLQGTFGWSFFYSFLAVVAVFCSPWLLTRNGMQKKIAKWFSKNGRFDAEVRFAFALIFILGAFTEVTGFHAIIGAFIAGLIISEITPDLPTEKLKSFGYGFFIPLFFILIGAKVDLPTLFSDMSNVFVLLVIIFVGVFSKLFGVGIVAWLTGYTTREGIALGLFHASRLSLIIAIVEIASRLNLVDNNMFSIFVLLALFTALAGPSLGKWVLPGKA